MTTPTAVHRIEVRSKDGLADPRAESAVAKAKAIGVPVQSATSAKVYLIEADLSERQISRIMHCLLADPVVESASSSTAPASANARIIEVHPLPGVMDPAAQTVREAILNLVGVDAEVSTGVRFDLLGVSADDALRLARTALANPVIHQINPGPWLPAELPKGHEYRLTRRSIPLRGLSDDQLSKLSRDAHLFLSLDEMRAVQAHYQKLNRDPTDIELETIAQTWSEHCVHKTLKSTVVYREEVKRPRVEETKQARATAASPFHPIDWSRRPGTTVNPDGSVTIKNLLKSTVAAATHELIADGVDWTLSVFKDNSGVIAFDDAWGVNIKVETHNRPSAIEPYGGAATGIGGCIRDVIATGLGAKPIASTDVFCVADPNTWVAGDEETKKRRDEEKQGVFPSDTSSLRLSVSPALLPPGALHPRRILADVVAGVRDYGNRIGIPTVSGGVFFDDRYVGNPLVFCGCVGLIPRHLVSGKAHAGDRIIALGGKTGRDGIHGATFSSAELGQSASSEFAHAVQIGNAIEEKRLLDAILRARDSETETRRDQADQVASRTASLRLSVSPSLPLFHAITDCGAGGFSSAIGEMASDLGATVHLDKAPVKYAGLSYTEIWISEAQERMILAVPPRNVPALGRICAEEGVGLADLGEFGTPNREIILHYAGEEVGRLSCTFLHEGLPSPTRQAVWGERDEETQRRRDEARTPSSNPTPSLRLSVSASLLSLLSHPTIASKHPIIRQYDHEVQGNTLIKPLVGPGARGPSDASVIEPVPGARRAIAISQGLQLGAGDPAVGGDPYQLALAGIDECVRNLVCVGADPARIAILDNFCWPGCEDPRNMGALVRACAGCYDGAKAYRTPFVSGKDSLSNQLRYTDPITGQSRLIEIPYTLLITGVAIVPDVARCVTMDAKRPGSMLMLIGPAADAGRLGGSLLQQVTPIDPSTVPRVDLNLGPTAARVVASLIERGLALSAHDCSEGGLLVAIVEMLIAGGPQEKNRRIGARLTCTPDKPGPLGFAFNESHSRYVLEVLPRDTSRVEELARAAGIQARTLGVLDVSGELTWPQGDLDADVESLAQAWLSPLAG